MSDSVAHILSADVSEGMSDVIKIMILFQQKQDFLKVKRGLQSLF